MEAQQASTSSDCYECGSNPGNHGINYEKDLAFVTFVAASLEESKFKLAVEMTAAEKFDDVIVFKEESKEVLLFQAKHSNRGEHVMFDDLFSNDPRKSKDFAFSRYIQSYLRIRENKVFESYKPTIIIFTNKKLEQIDKRKQLINIQVQNVNSIIKWCDSKKNLCFQPLNDEAVRKIKDIINSELFQIQEDIYKLVKTGKISDLLIQYKTPLQNILKIADGKISFKEPAVDSKDMITHRWMLAEFNWKPNENFPMNRLDDKTVKSLKSVFFTGKSRNNLLPVIVEEEQMREFFQSLIFCIEQPTDLRSVAEKMISSWMPRWVDSDLERESKYFLDCFDEVFKKWHAQILKQKDYLTFHKQGLDCIQYMKSELKKKFERKHSSIASNLSIYVSRTIIKTINKTDDDKIAPQTNRFTLNHESFGGKSKVQTIQMSDQDFIEQIYQQNAVSAGTKCQILIGEPGMGKTTLIYNLFWQSQNLKNVAVYLICLKNLNFCEEKKNDPLHIFEHELPQESRNILRNYLESSEIQIVFILDGFDEMNPAHQQSVLTIFEKILEKKNTQFIITGRKHVCKLLEDRFKAHALKLKPFDYNEQVKFLKLFWRVESSEALFMKFAEQLLKKFHNEIKGNDYDFAGLPLMVRMLAEVYADDFQKFLKTETADATCIFESEKLNVLNLFEKFVKISFNLKMKSKDRKAVYAYDEIEDKIDEEIEPSFDFCMEQLKLLAIRCLEIEELQDVIKKPPFNKNNNRLLERFRRGNEKSMLISASSADKIDFIHLSYAEYFVAKFLFDHIDECKFSLMKIIQDRDVVRQFFFLMVEHNCNENSEQMQIVQSLYSQNTVVVVWACLGGNEKIAMRLLRKSKIKSNDPYHKILMHAAVDGGSTGLVMALLGEFQLSVNIQYGHNFNDCDELPIDMFGKDSKFIFHGTPLHTAAGKGNIEMVKLLIDHNANIDTKDDEGCTPLHYASRNGNLEMVKLLIDNRANVDTTQNEGWTPLHYASQNGHIDVVKLLIDNRANVDTTQNEGCTPLHKAAENGHLDVVKLLIDNKANVDTAQSEGWTPLHYASRNGNLELVKLLIDNRANVDTAQYEGWTPLHYASRNGQLDVVKLLIDNRANVDTTQNEGCTPLHYASQNGNLELVKLLIDNRANVDTAQYEGWTPLHYASQNGQLDVVKLLIDNRANVDTTQNEGCTPLHYASRNGNLELVKLLIDNRANVDTAQYEGWTPLHYASRNGQLDVVKLLIDNRANVDTTQNEGCTPLHYASRNGNLELVKLLIDNRANVDTAQYEGWTPLHYASQNGQLDVVKLLIDNRANVDTTQNEGCTPLHYASRNGNLELVKLLIDNRANVDTAQYEGWTPLHYASRNGQLDVVKLLIDNRANVDTTQNEGCTPLHYASRNGNLELVKLLIENRANVDTAQNEGWTPLHYSSQNGHLKVVKLLIENKANVDTTQNEGWTPLHYAFQNGHLEVVKFLIDNGANVDTMNTRGSTSFHIVSQNGRLVLVKLLIDNRANVDTTDNEGWTPLHYASQNGHLEVVKLLIDNRANVDTTDNEGWTPLHYASRNGHLEVVKLLIDNGANVDTKNTRGSTSFHIASKNGRLEVVKLLIDNGANVDTTNNEGWTPLHYASRNGHLEVVKLLIDNGANVDTKNARGSTSFHIVSQNGRLEVVKLLIDNGANVDTTYNERWTLLHDASLNGHLEVVKLSIDNGANVDTTKNEG
ncbi:uncharacterized protein LOC5564954 isoform X2 [Aedes aegypti]|uniref:NACHT domain-containing protein n=1 Tax=Aedes aegypti TaxID=7159 RepID=A0A903UYA3_AEDAE|nr:uncharacterized protein LOC5564954 isoform X2 [Aedes aegypti]